MTSISSTNNANPPVTTKDVSKSSLADNNTLIVASLLSHILNQRTATGLFDVKDYFGPPEMEGFYPPIFNGFFGSGVSSMSKGKFSGPIGGLDGYGAGFSGPVGGIYGTVVGYNDGRGQGGPLGGLYSTLQGQAGWGGGGFGGGGYFPGGWFTGFGFLGDENPELSTTTPPASDETEPAEPPLPSDNKNPAELFGPPEKLGFFPRIFEGYFGSGVSSMSKGQWSGPIGGLDGYGAGFKGPVGGIYGTVVGYNDGRGQGGPLGGLYSTLQGQAGWGGGGYAGGGYFPGGSFSHYGFPEQTW